MAAPLYQPKATVDPPSFAISPEPASHLAADRHVGAALEKFSHAGVGFAVAVNKAQNATTAAEVKTEFISRMSDMEEAARTDPDYQAAPDKFFADRQALESELLERVSDPTSRGQLQLSMRQYGLISQRDIERTALGREAEDNRGMLDQREQAYVKRAAGAQSPVERNAVMTDWGADLRGQEEAGWITPQERHARQLRGMGAVQTADVQGTIAHSPAVAIAELGDPEEHRFIDPAAREQLANDAYGAEAAADIAPIAKVQGEGYQRLVKNMMDPAWLAGNSEAMSSADFRRFAAPPLPGDFDPKVYADLLDRSLDAGPDILGTGADRYREGRIDRAALEHVYDTAALFQREAADRPWAVDLARDVIRGLAPSDQQDPAEARRQVAASSQYLRWLSDNPEGDRDTGAAEADRIVRDARSVATDNERAKLPLLRYAPVSRDKFDGEALVTTAERLRSAYETGRVNDSELADGVDNLKRWHDLIGREGGE